MADSRNPKANELYAFILSEIASGRPFPTHSAMQGRVGTNFAKAVMDLVLTGRLIRERSKHSKQKYAYRLPDQCPGDLSANDSATTAGDHSQVGDRDRTS